MQLFSRILWTLALVSIFQFTVHAQSSKGNYNFLDFNQKPYYFGITLAYNTSDFRPFRSKDFISNDSIAGIESVGGPGFNLGIVTNLKIGGKVSAALVKNVSIAPTDGI